MTPPGGLAVTTWRDAAPPANQALFYVLQAESFEQPGCGDGPAQGGLSDTRDVGPIEDAVSADVIVGAGEVLDDSACATGSMTVTWDAATFPGAGNGRYHVHRSALSLADALAQPALSPVGGLVGTAWVDATLSPGFRSSAAVVRSILRCFPPGKSSMETTAPVHSTMPENMTDAPENCGFQILDCGFPSANWRTLPCNLQSAIRNPQSDD